MTAFLCSKCGTAITPQLAELAAVPNVSDDEHDRDKDTRRAPSTVPQGHYVIDAEPWGPPYVVQNDQEDPRPAQSRGLLVSGEEGLCHLSWRSGHSADVPRGRPRPSAAAQLGEQQRLLRAYR
ncbi:hypothetical protein ACGFYY_38520 [Streptomyces sp. NPDC048331]|uniref:hypothetical protein n=1 Tax=Streptomyces sp. NPDC048331 TaxID=3365534 RepID=UPI0037111BF6